MTTNENTNPDEQAKEESLNLTMEVEYADALRFLYKQEGKLNSKMTTPEWNREEAMAELMRLIDESIVINLWTGLPEGSEVREVREVPSIPESSADINPFSQGDTFKAASGRVTAIQFDTEVKTGFYRCVCGNENYIKMHIDREDPNFNSKFDAQLTRLTGDACYC